MTRETLVSLSPDEVVKQAKAFFSDASSGYGGTLMEEGEGYVRFRTFRGLLAIQADRDADKTRVRCSTLRYHPSVGKFMTQLQRPSPTAQARGPSPQ